MFAMITAITRVVSRINQPPPETNKPIGLPMRMANIVSDTPTTGRNTTATRLDQQPAANNANTMIVSSGKSIVRKSVLRGHEVTGPGDRRDGREVVFDLPQGRLCQLMRF
jgi:hypothetical protein